MDRLSLGKIRVHWRAVSQATIEEPMAQTADPHSASDDLLSSIRRLVVDAPTQSARLMLTPNLRVVSSTARPQPGAPMQRLHLQVHTRAGLTMPQLVATVTQGMDRGAMEWEPEIEQTVPQIDSMDLARFAQTRSAVHAPAPMAEDVPAEAHEAVAPPVLPEPVLPEPVLPEPDLPAPVLSEQVLRDLVRDLVREQFQGDLGLHITRSIRKLVKAEIAREMDLRAKE